MPGRRLDLPQGTLDLLILKALSVGPEHGWGLAQRIRRASRAALLIPQGSLYPALHRLERRGWIKARWALSDTNRRARFYELTSAGSRRLDAGTRAWHDLTTAVGLVLDLG